MPMTMPTTISIVAVTRRSRKGPSIWSLRVTPSTPIGMEPTITSQPIWASWSPAHRLVDERPEPRGEDPPDILAEIDQHRRLRAELGDRREGGARVLPAREGRRQPQMRAGGDGEELGQPLDESEDEGFKPRHGVTASKC